jgi:phage shock protein C
VQERPDGLLHDQRRARRPESLERLRKSRDDRLLLGILGGIATYTGLPAFWLRLAFALSVVISGGVTLLGYLALSLLLPGPKPADAA